MFVDPPSPPTVLADLRLPAAPRRSVGRPDRSNRLRVTVSGPVERSGEFRVAEGRTGEDVVRDAGLPVGVGNWYEIALVRRGVAGRPDRPLREGDAVTVRMRVGAYVVAVSLPSGASRSVPVYGAPSAAVFLAALPLGWFVGGDGRVTFRSVQDSDRRFSTRVPLVDPKASGFLLKPFDLLQIERPL